MNWNSLRIEILFLELIIKTLSKHYVGIFSSPIDEKVRQRFIVLSFYKFIEIYFFINNIMRAAW